MTVYDTDAYAPNTLTYKHLYINQPSPVNIYESRLICTESYGSASSCSDNGRFIRCRKKTEDFVGNL